MRSIGLSAALASLISAGFSEPAAAEEAGGAAAAALFRLDALPLGLGGSTAGASESVILGRFCREKGAVQGPASACSAPQQWTAGRRSVNCYYSETSGKRRAAPIGARSPPRIQL